MSLFNIERQNCKGCYKCLRACPVKAINLVDKHVEIIEERCISCGSCHSGCDHGAINTTSELEKAKKLIGSGKKVILSIDPTILGSFNVEAMDQMAGAAKKLGFWGVSDTSAGASAVIGEYLRLAKEGNMKNVVMSFCPAVCNLFEKYYTDLLDQLAPVISPVIAHGRIIKKAYPDAAVVYVGSCIAKLEESKDARHNKEINAVINYSELNSWFNEMNIEPSACDPEALLDVGGMARLYAVEGGILRCLNVLDEPIKYRQISVDGMDDCIEMLEAIRAGDIENCLIEIHACRDGCVSGSARVKRGISKFETKLKIEKNVKHFFNNNYELRDRGINLRKLVMNRGIVQYNPDEKQISKVLYSMGLDTQEWQLNCGACGYNTCREKAIAVLQGTSELSMCVPALRKRADRISNFVLDEYPMITILANDELKIIEFNTAAANAFKISRTEALNKYIFELFDPSDFQYVMDTGLAINNKKLRFEEYGLSVEASLVYIKDHGVVMGIYKDITADEESLEREYQRNINNVEMTQAVIDKQMAVAQQIASLLGETTAEIKVKLNTLKRQILHDNEET